MLESLFSIFFSMLNYMIGTSWFIALIAVGFLLGLVGLLQFIVLGRDK